MPSSSGNFELQFRKQIEALENAANNWLDQNTNSTSILNRYVVNLREALKSPIRLDLIISVAMELRWNSDSEVVSEGLCRAAANLLDEISRKLYNADVSSENWQNGYPDEISHVFYPKAVLGQVFAGVTFDAVAKVVMEKLGPTRRAFGDSQILENDDGLRFTAILMSRSEVLDHRLSGGDPPWIKVVNFFNNPYG